LIEEDINKKREAGSKVRLANQAAEEIRRMIIENCFSQWEPLSEPFLAKTLKISRTPVREALTLIEQEGLLKIIPGKGAFVIDLTKEDFREINALRVVLEPLAAETAVYYISEETVNEQKVMWTKIANDIRADHEIPIIDLTEADNQLHWLFIDNCDNGRLRKFLGVLRYQMMRYIHVVWETKAFMRETVEQHLEILSAVEEKNVTNLRRALKRHINFNKTVYAYGERKHTESGKNR
jgi:DNA-binding GntR family transcriptional regulator